MTSPDNPNRIPQLYGYAVCLIAVVTFLIAGHNVVNSTFDLASPERSRELMYNYPASYDDYRSQHMSRTRPEPHIRAIDVARDTSANVTPDSTLRRMYSEDRAKRIDNARYQALRSLVTSALLILAAAALFVTHWRWAKRYS